MLILTFFGSMVGRYGSVFFNQEIFDVFDFFIVEDQSIVGPSERKRLAFFDLVPLQDISESLVHLN